MDMGGWGDREDLGGVGGGGYHYQVILCEIFFFKKISEKKSVKTVW